MTPAFSRDDDWRADAGCRGEHALFLPPAGERELDRIAREACALVVCRTCPVIDPCRDWARAHREPFVAGGETAADRHAAGFAPLENGQHVVRDHLRLYPDPKGTP